MNKNTRTKKLVTLFTAIAAISMFSQIAAASINEDTREWKTFPKEMLEKSPMEKEREREYMRDKSHDNRLKIGENTSIGIVGDDFSIRSTFKLTKEF